MTTRILPPEEWHRLEGTELGPVCGSMNSLDIRVIVVESDGGEILGCWALLKMWHAEGIWVKDEHRKHGAVFGRLLKGMRAMVQHEGAMQFVTASISEDVTKLIGKLGGESLPGEHFVLPAKG